jgi:hypothetical protein
MRHETRWAVAFEGLGASGLEVAQALIEARGGKAAGERDIACDLGIGAACCGDLVLLWIGKPVDGSQRLEQRCPVRLTGPQQQRAIDVEQKQHQRILAAASGRCDRPKHRSKPAAPAGR